MKKIITKTIIMVILFLGVGLIRTEQTSAQINLPISERAIEQDLPGTTDASAEEPQGAFVSFLGAVLSFTMAIAALLVFMYLLWGALEWITAGGDSSKIESARNKMTQAVVGIIVLSATVAFFMVIQQFLGIEVINFASSTREAPNPYADPFR